MALCVLVCACRRAFGVSLQLYFFTITEAGDPDLDSLLADLCKLEEETAAAAAVSDTKPPTVTGNEEQMSGEEFASFMQSLQQSKNIIHDPISLAIYDTVKLSNQPSQTSLKSEVTTTATTRKDKANRPPPIQHSGHLDVQRPSVSTPLSPSHVSGNCVWMYLDSLCKGISLGVFTLEPIVLYVTVFTVQFLRTLLRLVLSVIIFCRSKYSNSWNCLLSSLNLTSH